MIMLEMPDFVYLTEYYEGTDETLQEVVETTLSICKQKKTGGERMRGMHSIADGRLIVCRELSCQIMSAQSIEFRYIKELTLWRFIVVICILII